MTDATNGKVEVDFADLTLGELDELDQTFDQPLEEMMGGKGKFKAMAAAAWLIRRRTDPDYTLADALTLKMNQLELVAGEVEAANVGGTPQPSPESGDSTLPTS
jgi:hypothetical protein